jgi:hypothetical protein
MHRLLLFALIAGCAPTTFAWTPSTGKGEVAKPDNCKVEVMTTPPSRNYENIGTLDYYNGTEPKNLDEFKAAVAKQACQAGGDAVVANGDEGRRYKKGMVIRYIAEPAQLVTPPPKSETEAKPSKPESKKK